MAELLVLFACLNNTGCSETSSQYYNQNPEFRELMDLREYQIKKAVGPVVTQYWAPIMWAAAGQQSTIRLSGRFYIDFKISNQVLMFKEEF